MLDFCCEQSLNAEAFKSLKMLVTLFVKELPDNIYEICNALSVIDVIRAEKSAISCYELVSGSTFEEATITEAPPSTISKLLHLANCSKLFNFYSEIPKNHQRPQQQQQDEQRQRRRRQQRKQQPQQKQQSHVEMQPTHWNHVKVPKIVMKMMDKRTGLRSLRTRCDTY